MSTAEFLSRRVQSLEPSATLAMNAKAKQLKAEGRDVISFSVGEPDFKTPEHICDAAKKAIDGGMHWYTASAGTPELRRAIAGSLERDIGIVYKPSQIVASSGAKYSLFLAMLALLNEGDEVIIPAPYWVSYPEMARLCGARPVIVDTREEDGFALDPGALSAAITPRTKMLLLNSPSNPTGKVTPPEIIREIGAIMEKKGIWCLADEIYNHLVYGSAVHKSVAAASDYCRRRTIVVNGCSKTYAMTGWRLGWMAADPAVAAAVDDLQSQTTSNPCSITQAAGVAALDGPQDCVSEMAAEFAGRARLIHRLLGEIPGVSSSLPSGAFYALPNISGLFGKTLHGVKVNSPADFCALALEKAFVAMVPGEPFGTGKHVRLSYATSRKNIEEGCARLKRLVEGN